MMLALLERTKKKNETRWAGLINDKHRSRTCLATYTYELSLSPEEALRRDRIGEWIFIIMEIIIEDEF